MQRIFLIGYMGSGKSAMGRLLAKSLGLQFYDLDSYIEGKFYLTIAQIFDQQGEESFREKERLCLHELSEIEDVVIATGGGAPCFFDNMDFMNQKGHTLYLDLSVSQLQARLESSRAGVRPLLKDKSSWELQDYIEENLQKRMPFYSQAKHHISGSDEEIVAKIKAFSPPSL